jgi:cellulase/cellobiase CelA1
MNFPTEIEIIVNGTTLGSLSVSSTGGWNNYRELSTNVRNITGVHDLVLRFSGPVNVDSFLFSSSSEAPQQPEPQQPWQPQPQPQPQQPGDTGNLSISVSENTWGGGATLNVTITNNGSTAVNGWTANLNFSGDVKVTSSWNANLNQSGSSVSVSNVDWNSTIQPGASVTFGFNISYSGSYSRPSASVK